MAKHAKLFQPTGSRADVLEKLGAALGALTLCRTREAWLKREQRTELLENFGQRNGRIVRREMRWVGNAKLRVSRALRQAKAPK